MALSRGPEAGGGWEPQGFRVGGVDWVLRLRGDVVGVEAPQFGDFDN